MKIVNNCTRTKIPLKSVAWSAVFTSGNYWYMRVFDDATVCRNLLTNYVPAVCLTTGILTPFDENWEVEVFPNAALFTDGDREPE